jgi:hypothetical protein
MAQQAAAITNKGGVDTDKLVAVGRPLGPDLQLKFNQTQLTTFSVGAGAAPIAGIITSDSSITEVLNIVSYLISDGGAGGGGGGGGVRNFASLVDTGNSVHTASATSGSIDIASGNYASDIAGAVTPATDPFLYTPTGNAAAATTPIINIDTFAPIDQTPGAGNIFIPVSIIKRRGGRPAAAGGNATDPDLFDPTPNRTIPGVAPGPQAVAIPLLSDCVKQMILILMQTRDIFGPKGWTNLFTKVKGGGGSSKKHTHRRHRRRYSSKQY